MASGRRGRPLRGPCFCRTGPAAYTFVVVPVRFVDAAGAVSVGTMGMILQLIATFLVATVAGVAMAMALRPLSSARRAERLARAQRDFHRQREFLEAKFIERAAASGKPRGLRWIDVQFDDDVVYARDRRSRRLKALVAVAVSFEAVEGEGMEDVAAVSNVRAATAEFLHDGTRWATEGRVYFNLAPSGTVKYLRKDLELVAEEHVGDRA